MTDIRTLTNDELARCVDLYFERVIADALAAKHEKDITLTVFTTYSSYSKKFAVAHVLRLGAYGGPEHTSANLFKSLNILMPRVQMDEELAPVEHCLALPAPQPNEVIIDHKELDDDMPF